MHEEVRGNGKNKCTLAKVGKCKGRKLACVPSCKGALLTPEKTHQCLHDTALHILSAVKSWQHLISNQQMGELQKQTLLCLSFHKQHATLGLSTKSTTAVITYARLLNCFVLYCSNQTQLRLTEFLLGLKQHATCIQI